MADKLNKEALLSCFNETESLSIHEVSERLSYKVAERTLRRWLSDAVNNGQLIRLGQKRATRYSLAQPSKAVPSFLQGYSEEQQKLLLSQLRDLWTHTSTAIEGNTLSLGDTHFILEEGLTVSGKSLKEHQEVLGHASAIELMYKALDKSISEQLCFDLHKAVQTEIIHDIDKPYGAWKVVPNYTYTVDENEQQVSLEYAKPQYVPVLMKSVLDTINASNMSQLSLSSAPKVYAKIHAAIAHIHPFWDGNGRIARLLANVPLLKSGLPPIIIPKEQRRLYIQLLASYELKVGELTPQTGPWPSIAELKNFEQFCIDCYQQTRNLIGLRNAN